jgi:hypothetical protein
MGGRARPFGAYAWISASEERALPLSRFDVGAGSMTERVADEVIGDGVGSMKGLCF